MTAIKEGLEQLGLGPVYHMKACIQKNQFDLWLSALEAKYEGKGKPWTTSEEFEQVMAGYEVLEPWQPSAPPDCQSLP
jgi:hypothetical protein